MCMITRCAVLLGHATVILIAKSQRSSADTKAVAMVYDLDTRLHFPTEATDYLKKTFGTTTGQAVPPRFAPYDLPARRLLSVRVVHAYTSVYCCVLAWLCGSLFRVVPAREYLAHFASDRSHMLAVPCDDDDDHHDPNGAAGTGSADVQTPAVAAAEQKWTAPPPKYDCIRTKGNVAYGLWNALSLSNHTRLIAVCSAPLPLFKTPR